MIGCDEEIALRNAIKEQFPKSLNALCTRHLRNNLDNYLQNKIGMTKKDRKKEINYIFGVGRLSFCKSFKIFDEKVTELLQYISTIVPDSTQLDNYLCGSRGYITAIRTGVVEPHITHNIQPNWTNNNAESINHMIKYAVEWKTLPLPKLVEKLEILVRTQENNIVKVLQGLGNFKLAPSMSHHLTSAKLWGILNEYDIHSRVSDFRKLKNLVSSKTALVRSSDGLLKVSSPLSKGRKPGQRRRRRAERTK